MDGQKQRVPLGQDGILAGPMAGISTEEYKLEVWYVFESPMRCRGQFFVKCDARSGTKGSFLD